VSGDIHADVVFQNDDLLGIVDSSPASRLHFLILLKKRRVRDATQLRNTAADRALLKQMDRAAHQVLRKAQHGCLYVEAEAAIGFHIHPHYSVPSLHLHAIYPRSAIPEDLRWKYLPGNQGMFRTPNWVAENLSELGYETEEWPTPPPPPPPPPGRKQPWAKAAAPSLHSAASGHHPKPR